MASVLIRTAQVTASLLMVSASCILKVYSSCLFLDGEFESYPHTYEFTLIPNDIQTPWRHQGNYFWILISGAFLFPSNFGDYFAWLQHGSSIEQTVTGLVVGRTYSVSLVYQGYNDHSVNIHVSIIGSEGRKDLYINNNIIPHSSWSDKAWVPVAETFVADSVEVVLKIWLSGNTYSRRSIDSVTFNLVEEVE